MENENSAPFLKKLAVFDNCSTISILLKNLDDYVFGLGCTSYIFHTDIELCSERLHPISSARGDRSILKLAGFGDLSELLQLEKITLSKVLLNPRSIFVTSENCANKFLTLFESPNNLFAQGVPRNNTAPNLWSIKTISDRGHNCFAQSLKIIGVENGLTFFVRGQGREIASLTLINYPQGLDCDPLKVTDQDTLIVDAENVNIVIISLIQLHVCALLDKVRSLKDEIIFSDDQSREPRARVMQDFLTLTPREMDVARGILNGDVVKKIASKLGCSQSNVQHYVRRIYKKLSVNTRGSAIIKLQLMKLGTQAGS